MVEQTEEENMKENTKKTPEQEGTTLRKLRERVQRQNIEIEHRERTKRKIAEKQKVFWEDVVDTQLNTLEWV